MLQKGKLLTSASVTIITKFLAAKNRSYLHFAIMAEDKCGTFKMDSSWCCALVRHQVNPCSYLYIFLYNHVQSRSFQEFLFQFSSLIQIKKFRSIFEFILRDLFQKCFSRQFQIVSHQYFLSYSAVEKLSIRLERVSNTF